MTTIKAISPNLVLGRLPKEVSGGIESQIALPDQQRFAGIPNVGVVLELGEEARDATMLSPGDVVFYCAYMARRIHPPGVDSHLVEVVHWNDVIATLDDHGFSEDELIELSHKVTS